MKALLQRVTKASVSSGGSVVGRINQGIVALVGVAVNDTEADADYLAHKIVTLRIFSDTQGKFDLSLLDIKADILLVSQFTLLANTLKGRRPSFTEAAPPGQARVLIDYLAQKLSAANVNVKTGRFQEHTQLEIHNDGPVTIMLDSQQKISRIILADNSYEELPPS